MTSFMSFPLGSQEKIVVINIVVMNRIKYKYIFNKITLTITL